MNENSSKGFFARIREGLVKTSSSLVSGISDVLTKRKLDEEALNEIEELLIMADCGTKVSNNLRNSLSKNRFEGTPTSLEVRTFLANEITNILNVFEKPLVVDKAAKPFIILAIGVNGTGKTTTLGKLANNFKKNGLNVAMVAGDTFRAAAVEQLKVWADRTNSKFYSGKNGCDAAGLIFDAISQSTKEKTDILLIDTAGRLQNKTHLMAELEKIVRVIKKVSPDAPHETLLVLDATTGQNIHSQVKLFSEIATISGLVVNKLDGTAKGGVAISLAEEVKTPLYYIGVGEGVDDLKEFKAKEFAYGIMDIK